MNNEENNNINTNTTLVNQVPVSPQPIEAPVQSTTPIVETQGQSTTESAVEPALTPNPASIGESQLPPSPTEQVVVPPVSGSETVVIDTVKKKGSNSILVVLVLLLAASVYFMDDIIKFFEENVISTNPGSVNNTDNYNLVDGFILLDDNTSYMKKEKIKFYNFKKNEAENSVSLNFVSEKIYNNISDSEIYIELYNSDKNILYKELFNPNEKIEKNMVRTYSLNLTNDVYYDAFYALVKTYTKEEIESKTTLTCKYKIEEEGYNLLYKNIYTFTNNTLINYEVLKELNVTTSNASSKKYLNDIKKEYETVNKVNIANTYENNKLTYKVDVNNLPEEFIPLYNNKSTPTVIKNKDTLKKWECE